MAPDGKRSALRRIADTLTASPPIVIASPETPNPGGEPVDPAGGAPWADEASAADHGTDRVFPCPNCMRPLGRGTGRCDGCGTRLVLDVPLSRAAVLAGAGLAIGVLAGGLGMAVFVPRTEAAPGAPAAPRSATGPSATSVAVLGVTIPSSAGAALRGTAALNGRLAAEAEPLAKAVAAKSFPTTSVVRILRRMSADVAAGSRMVPALGTWPDAAAHQGALAAFYAELAEEIDRALAASVKSGGPYKTAARRVLATLGQVPVLDADARVLAEGLDMDMPVVLIPDVLGGSTAP